ncbi:MAG: class I SAM-dependent methyltransferase [Desulfobacula sp.]|jgi:SAM-dependent methyltransferase
MMKQTCRLCRQDQLSCILELGGHPISHRLLKKKDQAEFIHPVRLFYCNHCGLIQLIDPIPPDELYSEYNWLSAWKSNPQIPDLLSRIQGINELTHTSKIIEIGSNDGSFLNELKKLGYQNLLGIEPSKDGYQSAIRNHIETIHDYFSMDLARSILDKQGPYDLIICRHVLEHIQDLEMFSAGLSSLLRRGGYILIEVPDADFILDETDYSQIWEEHTNYFTLTTLDYYLSRIGIRQIFTFTAQFSGQALIFGGKRDRENIICPPVLKTQQKKADAFKASWPKFKTGFHNYLNSLKQKNKKIAVYGAGCRACSLLNFTGISGYIDFIVDDQPEKQNSFLPGARLPIFGSEKLLSEHADICLLAVNAENNEKIVKKHKDYIDNGGEFIPILPGSNSLPSFWKNIRKA